MKTPSIVTLGLYRQLFVDGHLVRRMRGLRRRVQTACKHPLNPVLGPTMPWEGSYCLLYGSVIFDVDEGRWKMWYLTINKLRATPPEENTYVCYATSADGLRWDKPRLGIHSYRGRTDNNIVVKNFFQHVPNPRLDAMAVIRCGHETDARRRYKMACGIMVFGRKEMCLGGRGTSRISRPTACTGVSTATSPSCPAGMMPMIR